MSWTAVDLELEESSSDKDTEAASPEVTNESNEKKQYPTPAKITIPSAKEIRKATIEGIKNGTLPEHQDYCIVLQYLIDQFVRNNFQYEIVQENVPWLDDWLVNPFNANLLNEELELAARLEASNIHNQVSYALQGGFCTRTCGRFFACVCWCLPVYAIMCKICTYCLDNLLSCLWNALFDWWLGLFWRRYILSYLCYIPKYIKLKLEELFTDEAAFDDEELAIRNIYESNSYRIANQYACLLFLAIVLTMIGFCMVTVSYIYLPKHPDQLFMRAGSVIGLALLASGCFGLQFFCRCTL